MIAFPFLAPPRPTARISLHPLRRISADEIAAYPQARVRQGVSGRTVNMEVSVLRRMLKKVERSALMAEDVTNYPESRTSVER